MKKIFFLWMTLGWLTAINAQWIEQNSGTTESLGDVFCISADTVVVIGSNGTILRTSDGGNHWNSVTNPATEHLFRVKFIDTQTGFITGLNGTLLKSNDAGQTWQSLNTGTTEGLSALSCVSNDTIYIAGTHGYVSKTTDGGQTWNDISIPNVQDKYIIRMQFIGTTGYVVLSDNYNADLFKTTDDGLSWVKMTNYSNVNDFVMLNNNTGYISVSNEIKYTNDGFITESLIGYTSYYFYNYNLDYLPSDTLWTVGYGGTTNNMDNAIVKLNIGTGNSETYSCDLYDKTFYAIDFYNDQTGYVVGIGHNNQDTYGLILKNSTGDNPENGINDISKDIFSICPNPAKNIVFINLKDDSNHYPVQYRITDMQGKTLTVFKNLQDKEAVDVSRLTNGIYLIQVQTQGQVYTQKLLIQK